MALPEVFTFADGIDDLLDFAQGHGVSVPNSVARRCVRAAYREIMQSHDWSFLLANGRVQLQAAQDLTAVYDHTGGANERQLTATTDFPSWIEDAAIRIDDVVCDVESSISSTVVTLDAVLNPGADVASGTVTVYPRWYALPNDFGRMLAPLEKASWLIGEYVPFAEMSAMDAYRDAAGDVRWYSIGAAQDRYGQMALYVHPPSDSTDVLSFGYKKKPRDLRYTGYNTAEHVGTIAITASTATVTGTSTTFASGMVGAIIRWTNTSRPTGLEGTNPWLHQRVIASVASTTSLTLDAAIPAGTSFASVAYVISDPIDFDAAIWEAFLRCCEKHYALNRRLKELPQITAHYEDTLFRARGADARIGQRRICGVPPVSVTRLTQATDRPILS